MSLIGNIIWLVFGGFIAGLGYIVGGMVLCLTIVGIPFGLQSFKFGFAVMAPFGHEVQLEESSGGVLETIFNILWLVLFGWEIATTHLISGLLFAITIIGIPFARQHFKLIPLALFPFGRKFE